MKQPNRAPLFLLCAALGMFCLSLVFVWLHLTSPSDNARLGPEEPFGEGAWKPDGILVTSLGESARDLRQNDLLVAVDGISVESWAQALLTFDFPRPQWRAGEQVVYSVIRNGVRLDVPVSLRPYPLAENLRWAGTLPLMAVTLMVGTGYLYWRRPKEQATLPLFVWSICGLSAVISISIGLQTSDLVGAIGLWLFKVTVFGSAMLGMYCLLKFALVFPQPNPFLATYGNAVWLISALPMVGYGMYLLIMRQQASSMLGWIQRWNATFPIVVLTYLALTELVLVSGYLYTRHNTLTRQQSKLVVLSTFVMAALGIIFGVLPRMLLGHTLIDRNILALLPLIVLAAIMGAILRHRLFDIDLILNRALVYSALTTLVVALYGLIVGLLSTAFQASGNFLVSLVATGCVAILFQPLRDRLQRRVNHLMYGERNDPYAVLSKFGQRLEAAIAPAAVLPTIVETVGQALKLPYAAIAVKEGQDFTIVAVYGLSKNELLRLPLVYQGETLGQLILSARAPGEAFTSADRRLLDDLAHHAGMAIHAVRLTADLQRSRERLVTAREEERRRLRRDLHDGLGPVLAAMSYRLDAVDNLVESNPQAARQLVSDLKTQIQTSLDDIRRIAYGLRPPALDELGLIGALTEHIIAHNRSRSVQISLDVPQIPIQPAAALEVAAYRITLEALTNVIRHAHAQSCCIRLFLNESLCLEVVDDGWGIPGNIRAGVGITSMRERAEELGGTFVIEAIPGRGTRVAVRLPLPKDDKTG